MPTLVLNSCTIRPWRESDAESLVRHADNPRVVAYLHAGFPSPYTPQDAVAWIARNVDPLMVSGLAIEVDGEAAGSIGLRVEDVRQHEAEIGYWLGEACWGRGIVTEATAAMTCYGIEHLGLRRFEAHIYEPNLASVRVVEKNGYAFDRRLGERMVRGQMIDLLVYALTVEGAS